MTSMSAQLPSGASRRRAGHFGAWRAATAVPAMVGSLLLVLVLCGWMGRWEGLILLCWLVSPVALMTRAGERIAVRVGCGFRRPTAAQTARLMPVWSQALLRCGTDPRDVDLYVQETSESNASAAGGRSIAVTTGVLAQAQADRLADDYLVAVLVHELGHHATRATRFALVTVWLATPWRLAARLLIGFALTFAGRQPPRLLATVIVAGVGIAIVQAAEAGHWTVALVLAGVATAGVLCPVADAAVSRRSEFAADRYAAAAGVGRELAAALQILGTGQVQRPGLVSRVLSRHPSPAKRIAALSGTFP